MLLQKDIDSLAIGQFDCIHRAHKELFKHLSSHGGVVMINKSKSLVMPNKKREEYIGRPCFYYDFNSIKNLTGAEFLELLRNDFPSLKKIVVGYDFRFGKDRKFGVVELKNLFLGEVVVVEEYFYEGVSVHAHKIKMLLNEGNISWANRFLGRNYSIEGISKTGQGLGKKLFYPTINIDVKEYLLPKDGVYAAQTKIKDKMYDSVAFIGTRLSTDNAFSMESHLIETELNVKENETIELFFVDFLRENMKFDDPNELKKQIAEDIKMAKNRLKICEIRE